MKKLSPSHKSVLRIRGAIAAFMLILPAVVLDSAFVDDPAIPTGLFTAVVLVLAVLLVFVAPDRRYRAWGYDATEDELHVESGILFRSHTVVPFGRVQHIDVSQGPIERRYGVGSLTLHTAGTRNSAVVLPGLDHGEAERMRDEIRGKIRQDLA